MSTRALEWDAAAYHRVGSPQEQWAAEIIARMGLTGDEFVLDAGCGSGRVTALLLESLPSGRVIGVDSSEAMIDGARRTLGADPRAAFVCQSLTELVLDEPVDAIFSCAVFHHIHDHQRLFERLHAALRTGGRLVAQCGGEGNIDAFRTLADEVAGRSPYAEYLAAMPAPWHYAGPKDTATRLASAGFASISCWLEDKPTVPADARTFTETVLLNYHSDWLRRAAPPEAADELGRAFIDEVLAEAGSPLTLDYVRLNIDATAA